MPDVGQESEGRSENGYSVSAIRLIGSAQTGGTAPLRQGRSYRTRPSSHAGRAMVPGMRPLMGPGCNGHEERILFLLQRQAGRGRFPRTENRHADTEADDSEIVRNDGLLSQSVARRTEQMAVRVGHLGHERLRIGG